MNMNIISKYLQFLRKSNNYTQDDLAKELGISRQAVSKWETGTTIPDLEVLLKISKLYDITINDILEPKVQPQRITDFEQISTISEKELKEVLEQFDMDSLKFTLGSSTLGWCIFLMMLCVIISLWHPDNELVKNGFEAFKLIVMTILGYIFGSNNTKHD